MKTKIEKLAEAIDPSSSSGLCALCENSVDFEPVVVSVHDGHYLACATCVDEFQDDEPSEENDNAGENA